MSTPTAPASELKACQHSMGDHDEWGKCVVCAKDALKARLDQSEEMLKDMAGLLERVREYVRDNDDEELQALDSVLARFESMTKGGKRG
jgi:hypothetical protein